MNVEVPDHIVDAVREYRELCAIPVDSFPGDRNLALLNIVAYIGECLVTMISPPWGRAHAATKTLRGLPKPFVKRIKVQTRFRRQP